MGTRTSIRILERLAGAAGITPLELEEALQDVVEDIIDARRRKQHERTVITGAREVFGEGHATASYITDPEGTDIVPPGYEPPPGYRGPWN